MKTLYITHYGILEPLGKSQILPYLRGLAGLGHDIEIISFEKPEFMDQPSKADSLMKGLQSQGIVWHPRRYHGAQSTSQLLLEIMNAAREIHLRCSKKRFDLVHCRSHVPYLMASLGVLRHRTPLLFDFRGFLAEEYVDSGLWAAGGARFRITKTLERIFVRKCSALVVLTNAGKDYFQKVHSLPPEKLFVIPCCVDRSKFKMSQDRELLKPGRPIRAVYAGSTVGRYNMPAVLEFFALLLRKRPGSCLTILSTSKPDLMEAAVQKAGLPKNAAIVASLPHEQVPDVLRKQDLGLFFLQGDKTLLVASPTKIGEYLGCGLVVLAENRLADMKEILVDQGVGCLIDSSKPAKWPEALERALALCEAADFREKSARTAEQFYSLQTGVQTYSKAYEFAARKR